MGLSTAVDAAAAVAEATLAQQNAVVAVDLNDETRAAALAAGVAANVRYGVAGSDPPRDDRAPPEDEHESHDQKLQIITWKEQGKA